MAGLGLLPVQAIATMEDCRSEIDRIDDEILTLLARRMQASGQIGRLKRQGGLPTVQPDRERLIYERLSAAAGPGIGPGEVQAVWEAIIGCSRRIQQQVG
ncbi:MAG TPA: chorismate mutase [Symbiobacteriaceae bacterium]|nr:chorismate mutase [Symbiobacteriaceae bacterium]